MRGLKVVLAVAAASAGLAAASPAPLAQPGACFRSSDWRGWKATRDGSTLYISTGPQRVYRLELSHPCPALNDISAILITHSYGSDWVCRPHEIDLQVMRSMSGITTSCRIRRISRLYPSEVKALPKDMRP